MPTQPRSETLTVNKRSSWSPPSEAALYSNVLILPDQGVTFREASSSNTRLKGFAAEKGAEPWAERLGRGFPIICRTGLDPLTGGNW